MELSFTAREVARLAGFETAMMLDYLERSGTFRRQEGGSSHHGKRRKYGFRDLVVLRAINRLLKSGARPKRIEEAMGTFARLEDLPQDSDALMEFAKRSSLFVVTSERVIYCEPHQLVELCQKGQLAFSFMVDNRIALQPVAQAVAKYAEALLKKQPRNRATLERVLKQSALA